MFTQRLGPLTMAALALVGLLAAGTAAAQQKKPNIRVVWGDGSRFDNDSNPATPTDAYELFALSNYANGAGEFYVSHVYTTDLDGGTCPVIATVVDDDGKAGSAAGAFSCAR